LIIFKIILSSFRIIRIYRQIDKERRDSFEKNVNSYFTSCGKEPREEIKMFTLRPYCTFGKQFYKPKYFDLEDGNISIGLAHYYCFKRGSQGHSDLGKSKLFHLIDQTSDDNGNIIITSCLKNEDIQRSFDEVYEDYNRYNLFHKAPDLRKEEVNLVKYFLENLKKEKPQIMKKLNQRSARLYKGVLGRYSL